MSKQTKASDVLAQTSFLVRGRTDSFSKAFPKIKNVRVTVEETNAGEPVRTHYRDTGDASVVLRK